MANALTLAQTISIVTQNSVAPWRASGLRNTFGNGTLSLRSVRDTVQKLNTIMVLEVRDPSIIAGSSSLAEFQANWQSLNKAWVLSRASLVQLIETLNANGVSVHGPSGDWRTIGISGVAADVAAVPVGSGINWDQVATGVEIVGAAVVAIAVVGLGGVPLGLGVLLTSTEGIAAVGGSLAVEGAGLFKIADGFLSGTPTGGSSPTPIPSSDIDAGLVSYGTSPSDAGTIANAPEVSSANLPDQPSLPPKATGDKETGDKEIIEKDGDKEAGVKEAGDKEAGEKDAGMKEGGEKEAGDKESSDTGKESSETGEEGAGFASVEQVHTSVWAGSARPFEKVWNANAEWDRFTA